MLYNLNLNLKLNIENDTLRIEDILNVLLNTKLNELENTISSNDEFTLTFKGE